MFNILIILFMIFFSTNNREVAEPIYIHKTELGFDIYSIDEELILEFTTENSDSTELQLLEYIYDEVRFNREEKLKEVPIEKGEEVKKI